MKRTLKLLAVLLAMVATACSNDKDPVEGANFHRNAKYTMRLRLGGEYVEESDAPLTKAANDAPGAIFYGVNVSRKENGVNKCYAHGLFTDKTKMVIDLYAGEEYEFEVTVLKNNTDILQLEGSNFGTPFRVTNSISYRTDDLNKFIKSTEKRFISLNVGSANVTSNMDGAPYDYYYPRVHRYYGKISYTCLSGDNEIFIPMEYKCVGLKITSESLPEGSQLTWKDVTNSSSSVAQNLKFSSNASFTYDVTKENSGGYSWEDVYSLNSFLNSTKTINLRFTLTRADNTSKTFDKEVTLTREMKKILNVVIDGNVQSTGTMINLPDLDDELEDESVENVNFTL